MRIVLTTPGGAYGRWVAEDLRARGVPIAGVLVDVHVPPPRLALRNPRRALGPLRRRLQAAPLRRIAPLRTTGNINGDRGRRLLAELRPDVLVLAGARIVAADVLAIPASGTYNAHPAVLPGFRGTGVVGWSILERAPVSITVHEVSPKLDAGDVVARRLVPIEPADSLATIEARADRMCAEALADVVACIYHGETLTREPQIGPSPIYRWLDREQRAQAERLVADGTVMRVYREALGRAQS